MRVPKDLGELEKATMSERQANTYPPFHIFEGHISTKEMDGNNRPNSHGRFVPDDLLRERFCFQGEVKLTREEATRIHYLVSGFRILFKVNRYPVQEANSDEIIDILQSKLAKEEKE